MHLSDKSHNDKVGGSLKAVKVGDRLKNVHTENEYTVIELDEIKNNPANITVIVLADDLMVEHRISFEYLKHYQPVE
jgi:hypothetical protein